MDEEGARRAVRRGIPSLLLVLGGGVALALHRPSDLGAGPEPVPVSPAIERALREERLEESAGSVRLLRGLEQHLSQRRAGP